MPRARISKEFKFEAAHVLPNHDGKCRNLHGHSYRAIIVCEGEISELKNSPTEGMVLDFTTISRLWKDKLEPYLDHRYLNDEPVGAFVTTAENIALWICRVAYMHHFPVVEVTVFETATSSATVTVEEASKV